MKLELHSTAVVQASPAALKGNLGGDASFMLHMIYLEP